MKFSRPTLSREIMLDMVVMDQSGRIWLQQQKPTAPDWTLLRGRVTEPDVLGYAHQELTSLGFIVHEVMVLREGALYWTYNKKPLRMSHILLVAEVNVGEPPQSKTHYLQAFAYADSLKLPQRYSDGLKQLYDPTIDVMVRRQKIT